MKKLLACTLVTGFNFTFAMETDPAKIAPHVDCALTYAYRLALRTVKEGRGPNAFIELVRKLQDPAQTLPSELESLLKDTLLLSDEGKVYDPLRTAVAVSAECSVELQLQDKDKERTLLHNLQTTLMGGALESIYKKTKYQLGIPLLQRMINPASSLPKDVEQLLKDEHILDDGGKVVDVEGMCLALTAKADQLRDKFTSDDPKN